MAVRILSAERPGTEAVRGIVQYWALRAAETLGRKPLGARAVHDARKAIKKARAALRLLRDALGEPVYRRENRALRDAARELNAARDAQVLVQAMTQLLRREPALAADRGRIALARALEREQRRLGRALQRRPAPIHRARTMLERSVRRSKRWTLRRHGWAAFGPALERVYRAGRRAWRLTRARPTDETLHEWRKQAKYLWHLLQILQAIAPRRLGAFAQRTRRLADRLGDDHDLALLRRRALAVPPAYRSQALVESIDRRRQRLQHSALRRGAALYRGKPRAVGARLRHEWRVWREARH